MTALTILAKTSVVHVVLRVAVITGTTEAHLFHGLYVALGTFQTAVLTGKREVRLPVMIEAPVFPAARAMTGFTLGTQASAMFIVLAVTGNAGHRRIPEGLLLVTLLALHPGMLTQ